VPFRSVGGGKFAADVGGLLDARKASSHSAKDAHGRGSRSLDARREEVDATCLAGPGNPGSIDRDAHLGQLLRYPPIHRADIK
jgi:hypothetical protein